MSGRHAGRGLSRLRVAWLGARELVIFAAVGLAVPVVLLMTLPQLLEGGASMVDAPTCTAGSTTDCLEVRDGSASEVELAKSTEVPSGEVKVLRWNGDAVALLQQDGKVVDGLRWAQLYAVDVRLLWLAPLWPAGIGAVCLLFLRRHPRKVVVLLIVALGAAAAGPVAGAGMLHYGYHGLVAGGFGTLGLAFITAGTALWAMRRRARYRAKRVERRPAPMPAQREHREQPQPAGRTPAGPQE